MNRSISMACLLLLSSMAHARILSVEVDRQRTTVGQTVYIGVMESCPGTFQSIAPATKKIGDNQAIVELRPMLEVETCRPNVKDIRFFITIDNDLRAFGLNPKTTEVYFQLQ